MVDLVFGVPPRFSGHEDEDGCPGFLYRTCRENPAVCPPSTFMCPVPPLSNLEYLYLFPFTGPGGNRAPARFLGLDDQRTIGELRPSIENTLRLYKVIESAVGFGNMNWLLTYRAEVSQIAQGDVSMPRSFMEMEFALIQMGAPFTLTGLGVPTFLPTGVEVTWADVADVLVQIMTREELIGVVADLDAVGATELSNAINDAINGNGVPPPDVDIPPVDDGIPPDVDLPPVDDGIPPDGNGVPPPDVDIPPVDDGIPSNGNGIDIPDGEPIIAGDALSLLLGGGIIAAALALS